MPAVHQSEVEEILEVVLHVSTVKPQKTEIKTVTKTGIYRQATAKFSMLALHNAPI